jgi:hypothetical protein
MTAEFKQPDYNTQTGTEYPLTLDAAIAVLAQFAGQFYPQILLTPARASFAGGSLAERTYYVSVTLQHVSLGESSPTAEAMIVVPANYRLRVISPAAYYYATGWHVYVGTSPGVGTKQNVSLLSFGANWDEPVSGLISGAALSQALSLVIGFGRTLKDYATAPLFNQSIAGLFILTAANVTNPRIDRIVLDKFGTGNRLTGTPATPPVAPALAVNQFPCAQIYVAANATQLTNSNITDERCSYLFP